MAPNGVGEAAVGSSPSEDPNAPFVFTQALFSELQGAITRLRQEVAGVTGKVTELSQRQATSPYNAASSSSISDIWECLDHRQDNPIHRPSFLKDGSTPPALFDLQLHAGARRVKATLGVAAGYEVQPLGCALSYLYDASAALQSVTADVEQWPTSSGTV